MVYASIPSYLDPPDWNQQQQQEQIHQRLQEPGGGGNGGKSQQVPPRAPEGRPISMADRAREAKLPQPEQALKCPRCDSTNTKFCYYNNYSLSQPRHFCKACRRYWTRGGALRNVPVGGGCRRNKRTGKSAGRSKSSNSGCKTAPSMGASQMAAPAASSNYRAGGGALIGSNITQPFLASSSLSTLADFGLNFNFSGIPTVDAVDYQVVGSSSGVGLDQWRPQQVQQFSLIFNGFESTSAATATTTVGLYPLEGEAPLDATSLANAQQFIGKTSAASGVLTFINPSPAKTEDNKQERLNLPKQYLDVNPAGNGQYWGGSGTAAGGGGRTSTTGGLGWADMVDFNSPATGNFL